METPQVDLQTLRERVGAVIPNADWLVLRWQNSKTLLGVPWLESDEARPLVGSPEFRKYLEAVVKSSSGRREAARVMGYRDPKTVWYHMRKLGIPSPRQWSRRPYLATVSRRNVPEVVIPTPEGRSWVAGLIQGEGCIQSRYIRQTDTTYLQLDTSMADPAPIRRLCDYVGLKSPFKPVKNHHWKPNWHTNITGLRALRILQEILPFLLGDKRREAERAVVFFSPYGNHPGGYRNSDIWPTSEFPSRTKGRGSNRWSGELGSGPVDAPAWKVPKELVNPLPSWRVIPEVIIPGTADRQWVGGLVQGEGSTQTHYVHATNSTTVVLAVAMTDSAPVFRFSDLVGLPRPSKPEPNANPRPLPKWRKEVSGLRAYRVLTETQPFLMGEKSREVQKALEFFAPNGIHRGGWFSALDVWPPDEFSLRRRRPEARIEEGK